MHQDAGWPEFLPAHHSLCTWSNALFCTRREAAASAKSPPGLTYGRSRNDSGSSAGSYLLRKSPLSSKLRTQELKRLWERCRRLLPSHTFPTFVFPATHRGGSAGDKWAQGDDNQARTRVSAPHESRQHWVTQSAYPPM